MTRDQSKIWPLPRRWTRNSLLSGELWVTFCDELTSGIGMRSQLVSQNTSRNRGSWSMLRSKRLSIWDVGSRAFVLIYEASPTTLEATCDIRLLSITCKYDTGYEITILGAKVLSECLNRFWNSHFIFQMETLSRIIKRICECMLNYPLLRAWRVNGDSSLRLLLRNLEWVSCKFSASNQGGC